MAWFLQSAIQLAPGSSFFASEDKLEVQNIKKEEEARKRAKEKLIEKRQGHYKVIEPFLVWKERLQ